MECLKVAIVRNKPKSLTFPVAMQTAVTQPLHLRQLIAGGLL